MFEAIRKKIDEQNKDNNPKNMSLEPTHKLKN